MSENSIAPAMVKQEIARIVEVSVQRNLELDVTGALIFTGNFFAQRLEGPQSSIDALMQSIKLDERHKRIRIVDYGPLRSRLFSRWNMAYNGESSFIENRVSALLFADEKELARGAHSLMKLMLAFQD